MIVSKAPVRITLAGGTTDLEGYYSKQGGFLVAAGIDKYTYVMLNRDYREHQYDEPRIQVLLKDDESHIHIQTMPDVPIGCGLGTSGSFTVALIKALYELRNQTGWTQKHIAEKACWVEIDLLKEPIGKQDQYVAAFGGLNAYTFNKTGTVDVEPLNLTSMAMGKLRERLLLFDTQIKRRASDVLTEVRGGMEGLIDKLDIIKDMAYEVRRLLQHSQFDDFGLLLDNYWGQRKKLSHKISNPILDEYYEGAIKNGALGGKLQGAGGGGFFMFYVPINQEKFIQAMLKLGLKVMDWDWDMIGVTCAIL